MSLSNIIMKFIKQAYSVIYISHIAIAYRSDQRVKGLAIDKRIHQRSGYVQSSS